MQQLDDNWIDLLTSHASGRFVWIDVRSDSERRHRPAPKGIPHIPIEQLASRVHDECGRRTELVVFGRDDAETVQAERILKGVGYRDVLAFSGGYTALARGFGW